MVLEKTKEILGTRFGYVSNSQQLVPCLYDYDNTLTVENS